MVKSKKKVPPAKAESDKSYDIIWSLSFSAFLLSFYFIYFLFRIRPQLIYQAQQPVFFFDWHYIRGFFSYPGGIIELISGFISQFFYYSWTGALLLAILFGLIAWNTKLLVRSANPGRPVMYLHWIPSIFLLALHSNYRFPPILTLGLLIVLAGANFYIRLASRNFTPRLVFYIIVHAVIYYVTAGQVFIFVTLIVFYEVLYHRRVVLPLLYIMFAGALPYIAASYLFIVSVKDAYTTHLISYAAFKVTWFSWILCGFFPLVLVLCKFSVRHIGRKKEGAKNLLNRFLYSRSVPIRLACSIVFLILAGISVFYSYNKKVKAFYLTDYYAHFGKWDKVLDMAKEGLPISDIVQCQINRALYHSGLLCDKLFSVAQLFGSDGLFMRENLRTVYSLQHSDLFFDFGLVNISEQWVYESISLKGDTAWNLQRLAIINLLKEKNDIAAKYLKMLRRTLWHRKWAMEHQKYLSDSSDFWAKPLYRHIKNVMPKSDFLVSPAEPSLCLEELLKDKKNKMAFEYFMAQCLLEGKIGTFIKNINLLNDFDYPKTPRHFEEAMLVYKQLTAGRDIALPEIKISEDTIRKFEDFNRIRMKYKGDKKAAYGELVKYRDTYWFYGLYYYHPEE